MSETKGKNPIVNIVIIVLVIGALGGIYFLKGGKNTVPPGEVELNFPALVDYGSHG